MKGIKYIKYILLALSLVAFIVFFIFLPTTQDEPILNVYIGWAYILMAIAALLAIGFPLVRAIKSPKGLLKIGILLVGVLVIVGGSYLLAPGTPIDTNEVVSDSTFKFTDTALIITYIALGASILAIIASTILNSIKNR